MLIPRHVLFTCLCSAILLSMITTPVAGQNINLAFAAYSNVIPSDARYAMDYNFQTSWTVPADQTTANFSADFERVYTVSAKEILSIIYYHSTLLVYQLQTQFSD